jgi:hypothetical protein
MKCKRFALQTGISIILASLLIIGAAAQSLVSTAIFTPPGIANNLGFDFEVAVVGSTGLVYVGAGGAYGNEVGVINPATDSIISVIDLPTPGGLNYAQVNQATSLVYFRQNPSNIVVIDGRSSSPSFNQALANEVEAQRDKKLTDVEADLVLALISAVIDGVC